MLSRFIGRPEMPARRIAEVLREHLDARLAARLLGAAEIFAAGLTNREIAVRLRKSQRTVETQVQQIFAALGVNRRVMIARRINVS